MKKLLTLCVTFLTLVSLALSLPATASAAGIDGAAAGNDAQAMSRSWFSNQQRLSENSPGSLHDLFEYFKYREADFGPGHVDSSGSSVLKSAAVADKEKERTAAVQNLRKSGIMNILDASVSVMIQSAVSDGDLIDVTAYEWTFFDYDDLRDNVYRPDVSGFGTLHHLTLEATVSTCRIIGDAYDESDIDGISTYNVTTQPPRFASPSDASAVPNYCTAYNPGAAAKYADAHVWKGADLSGAGVYEDYYSPEYYNFNAVGGDCTNYVSQCLYAGGLSQTAGSSFGQDGWYFNTEADRSDTWTRATMLRRWLANNYGPAVDNPKNSDILVGSPVFYSRSGGADWDHATICVGVNSAGTPVVNSHNNDRYHVVWNYWPAGTTISTVQLTKMDPSSGSAWSSDRLSIATYGYPSSIKTGRGFSVYGTVTSEHSRINTVTVGVYDLGGTMVIGGSIVPKNKTAVLDTLDSDIRFGTLKQGWYYYRVTAANQSGTATLVNKLFLVNNGTGSQDDPYLIDSAAMLASLSQAVGAGRDYKGAYFRLTSDVSLAGTAWVPVGTEKAPFCGNFDGYTHTVSGLLNSRQAIFGWTQDSVISNLAADGFIAGTNGGTLVNCLASGGDLVQAAAKNSSLINCWHPAAESTTADTLNTFVKDTDKNGAGRYFLWKSGVQHPEFAPLTATFYSQTERTTPLATVTGLPYGVKITVPVLNVQPGLSASQWYQDTGLIKTWDASMPVTADLSLYAALKRERYNILLDADGGSAVNTPGVKNYGDALSLPAPTKDGFTFAGWHTDDGTKADWTTVPDLGDDGQTVTLYAGWTAKKFALELNAAGAGNSYTTNASVTYGSDDLNVMVLPEKADAGFAGYFTADGLQLIDIYGKLISGAKGYTDDGGNWIGTPFGSIPLFARWNNGACTITYDTNYGSLSGCTEVTKNRVYIKSGEIGSTISLPFPVRSGYTFNGWYGSGDFSGPMIRSLKTRANTTLYARWTANNLTWNDVYSDVRPGDWYYDGVRYVSQNSLMNGVSGVSFDPASGMTRGMLMTVLWRAEGAPNPAGSNGFSDVPENQWYTAAVTWAAENDIAKGTGNGLFTPEGVLTRQDFMTIIYRYAHYIGKDVSVPSNAGLKAYSDGGQVADYAVSSVVWAVNTGLLTGTTAKTLSPKLPVTRASVATLLMRFGE